MKSFKDLNKPVQIHDQLVISKLVFFKGKNRKLLTKYFENYAIIEIDLKLHPLSDSQTKKEGDLLNELYGNKKSCRA